MSENKLLVQRIGLIGLMNFLTSISGIVLLPILTKNMPIDDYGIWAQVNVTVGLISILILLGLPNSMVRFMSGARLQGEILKDFYSIFALVAFTGALTSFVFFYCSDFLSFYLFNSDHVITQVLAPMIFLESMNALIFNFFRTFQRMKLYSFFTFAGLYLSVILAYYFVKTDWGIHGAVLGLLITKAFLFIIMFGLILKELGLSMPNFRRIQGYLSFGLPLVPSGLSDWIINSSDRYIISIFFGTAYVGYYSPGYILGNIMVMLINPLSCMLPVVLSKHYNDNRIDLVKSLMTSSIRYFLMLALPSVAGLSLLSRPILYALSTPEIAENGYIITPFVALGMLFFGISLILTNAIWLAKRTQISATIWLIAAIFNLVFNILFIPYMGILGAAIATLLAFMFVFSLTTYYALRFIRLYIDRKSILKSVLASLTMSLFILRYPPEGLLEIIGTIALCIVIYFLALWILKGIQKEEIVFLKDILQKH